MPAVPCCALPCLCQLELQLGNQIDTTVVLYLPARLQGLDALGRSKPGNLARPRRFELAAAINRLRTAQLRQVQG